MRNVSDRSCIENHNPHLISITCFTANRSVYEKTSRQYIVKPNRPQMTIWRTRIACRIPKTTNTHSECAILLLFHGNSNCIKVPRYYVIRPLPVLFKLRSVVGRWICVCVCMAPVAWFWQGQNRSTKKKSNSVLHKHQIDLAWDWIRPPVQTDQWPIAWAVARLEDFIG